MGWLIGNWVELVSAMLGLVYIYFELKENIWVWPVGLTTACFWGYLYSLENLTAMMVLQFYYAVVAIIGWKNWRQNNNESSKPLSISHVTVLHASLVFSISALAFVATWAALEKFTPSNMPYLDAFISIFSLAGSWFLAKKIIEHWLVWIVVNLTSVAVHIYLELYFMSILYLVYLILSFVGYYEWKKRMLV